MCRLNAVETGHTNVHQYHVWFEFCRQFKRAFAVSSLADDSVGPVFLK
jgi:hypothetical protein